MLGHETLQLKFDIDRYEELLLCYGTDDIM